MPRLQKDDLPRWKDRFEAKLCLLDQACLAGKSIGGNSPALPLADWEDGLRYCHSNKTPSHCFSADARAQDLLDKVRASFAAWGVPVRPRVERGGSESSTAEPSQQAAASTPSPKKNYTETVIRYLKSTDGDQRGVFQVHQAATFCLLGLLRKSR